MAYISPYVSYNGSTLILTLSIVTCAIWLSFLIRVRLLRQGLRCRDVMQTGITRILFGVTFLFYSIAVSKIIWFPSGLLVIIKDIKLEECRYLDAIEFVTRNCKDNILRISDLQFEYSKIAIVLVNFSNIFVVISVVIILWPIFNQYLGKLIIPSLIFFMMLFYYFGMKLLEYIVLSF